MTKITFVNGTTPALNATNLNQMQTNIENAINNKITTNNEFATDEYIDNKRVYRKRVRGTWGSDNTLTISTNLSAISYTAIRFNAFVRREDALFDINTPRAVDTETQNTQLYGFWDIRNDQFICNSNGYSRQGTVVEVDLYYTKN